MEPANFFVMVGNHYMGFGPFPTLRLVTRKNAVKLTYREARTWLHDDRMNDLMTGCANGTIARIVRVKTSAKGTN